LKLFTSSQNKRSPGKTADSFIVCFTQHQLISKATTSQLVPSFSLFWSQTACDCDALVVTLPASHLLQHDSLKAKIAFIFARAKPSLGLLLAFSLAAAITAEPNPI
jgi:hypothetical protein